MKKLVMTVAVLACAASFVSAQTVTSANMVGFTKVNAVGGELTLVALNFETGGTLISELMPQASTPTDTKVYLWDKAVSTYAVATLGSRGWSGDRTLYMGDAFWIESGAAAGVTNEVIISGEVLTDDAVINFPAGIVATGYYYPIGFDFKTTQFSADLAVSSVVYIWDGSAQAYVVWTKGSRGWTGSGSAMIDPKQGFWVDNAGAETNVVETVPFTP